MNSIWEELLRVRLEAEGLTLQAPDKVINVNDLVALIAVDPRPRFYITNSSFAPPAFEAQFAARGFGGVIPLNFGTFKPDFIEIRTLQFDTPSSPVRKVQWKIIDAKASGKVKISHQVQIGFYHLCLSTLLAESSQSTLSGLEFVEGDMGEVWIPHPNSSGYSNQNQPIPDNTFPLALLRPTLETLLFTDIPRLLVQNLESVAWHFNPMCGGCDFAERCRDETVKGGTLSSIPHISFGDHRFVLQLLAYHRQTNPTAGWSGRDIEDIHLLVHSKGPGGSAPVDALEKGMPSTFDRLRKVLTLRKGRNGPLNECNIEESPLLRAAIKGTVEVMGRRCLTFPRSEDLGIHISLGIDPNSEQLYAFSIGVVGFHDGVTLRTEDGVMASGDEPDFGTTFVQRLADIIRSVQALKDQAVEKSSPSSPPSLRVQFYLFSTLEYDALVTLLVTQACRYAVPSSSSPSSSVYTDARLCIGAMLETSDVLLTTVQPELIASSHLFNAGASTLLVNDLQRYLRVFEGPHANFKGLRKAELQERLRKVLERMSGPARVSGLARMLPKVSVVHSAVKSLLAIPSPGFYQLDALKSLLVDGAVPEPPDRIGGRVDKSAESAYVAWKQGKADEVVEVLRSRREAMRDVCTALRARVTAYCGEIGADVNYILPTEAADFVVAYIELCQNKHLKRLLFMRQFEMTTELNQLLHDRITDSRSIHLTYLSTSPQKGYAHRFICTRGAHFLEAGGGDAPFFKYLLVRHTPTQNATTTTTTTTPDMYFDDLKVCDMYYMKLTVEGQAKEVEGNVAFANVTDVVFEAEARVVVEFEVKGMGAAGMRGCEFRLRQRLVDFNTKKVVKNLVDLEADAASSPTPPLFLRMLDDVNAVGRIEPDHLDQDLKGEQVVNGIYNAYYELQPFDAPKPLRFQASQRRAFQAVLRQSVTLIWGPPGHGKTHTLALSSLRLMELAGRRKRNSTPCRILMTACTNAAIDNFVCKFKKLLSHVRAIPGMERGEWRDAVDVFVLGGHNSETGNNNTSNNNNGNAAKSPDPTTLPRYCILAGTVWQLFKYLEKYKSKCDFDVLIIDEGSQMPVGDAAIAVRALSGAACERTKRVVVAGDHLQLAPVLRGCYPHATDPDDPKLFGSVLDCLMRKETGLAVSLDRTRASASVGASADADALIKVAGSTFGPLTHMLNENFRMVDQLCRFTNTIYKGGKFEMQRGDREMRDAILEWVDDTGGRAAPVGTREFWKRVAESRNALVTILLHPNVPASTTTGTPKKPSVDFLPFEIHLQTEAKVVATIVKGARGCFPTARIFVVTPHRAQRAAVGALLRKEGTFKPGEDGVDPLMRVDTVERCQGDEAEIVVACYGFTTHLSQLESELDFVFHRNRLNVALSRAKNLCILVASQSVIVPPIAALATPERREAFAHMKLFKDMSCVVPWAIEMGGVDVGGPEVEAAEDDEEEEDVWEDALDDDALAEVMDRVEALQIATG
ncbi:hypothetical protein HK104_011368 [Borealophlyctis nickersoniae]|nr:hypothetical protein HK104_011368 [Borealophlyctis nickersoniae]